MTRIPVADSIRAAYRFTFEHLGAIIGLIWLPMIIGTVLGFFVKQRAYLIFANALASGNDARLGPALLGLLFYGLAFMLLTAMMAVPVTELALGKRQSGTLARFAFGPAEWRLFKSSLGLMAFLLSSLVLATLASRLAVPPAAQAGVAALANLFMAGWLLFFAMRLGFLMPAIAVSEDAPILPRSWKLSAGNFWALLAVILGAVGPVLLLAGLVEMLIQGPAAIAPGLQGPAPMMAAQLNSASQNMPLTAGLDFLMAPLVMGQMLGAAAAAYRALAGKDNPLVSDGR